MICRMGQVELFKLIGSSGSFASSWSFTARIINVRFVDSEILYPLFYFVAVFGLYYCYKRAILTFGID